MNTVSLARSVPSAAIIAALTLAPVTPALASPLGQAPHKVLRLQEVGGAPPAEAPPVEATPDTTAPLAEGPAPASPAPAPEEPPRKGLGMLISGAVLVGVGLPILISGTILLVASRKTANDPEAVDDISGGLGLFAMIFAVPMVAVGAPLLGIGAHRFSKYRKWKASHGAHLVPTVGRTAFGTVTPGLVLRF